MSFKQKVWDVVVPKDAWGRSYAKMAYEHEGLRQVATRKITVRDESEAARPWQRMGKSYDLVTGKPTSVSVGFFYDWEGLGE